MSTEYLPVPTPAGRLVGWSNHAGHFAARTEWAHNLRSDPLKSAGIAETLTLSRVDYTVCLHFAPAPTVTESTPYGDRPAFEYRGWAVRWAEWHHALTRHNWQNVNEMHGTESARRALEPVARAIVDYFLDTAPGQALRNDAATADRASIVAKLRARAQMLRTAADVADLLADRAENGAAIDDATRTTAHYPDKV